MEVIDRILEQAFRQPPKFSTLDRYLNHQHILLETDVDDAGNAPDTVKEDSFPGNLDPPHRFSIEGSISASKKRPPKGWSYWDSTLEKDQQLYITTDSLNKRLSDQYWNQGRVVPVFRDERLKKKSYPMFVRDDISQQEMHLNFNQEII
ncbi:hypothetical protein M758_4G133500 [Ceratodon purpureus]|nr:hypothetical protein M758_4G133500 [Ceratodon purpureus]